VLGSSTSLGALFVPVKLNRPSNEPAFASWDPFPIGGRAQLYSMNWVIDD
jgi:hypothetical protein